MNLAYQAISAISLFKTASSSGSALGDKTEIDFQEIAVTIFLKFIDVLEGVAIIVVGIFAMKYIKHYFSKVETLHERQRTAINLLEKIISGFVITVAITLGLKIIGLDLTILISVLTLGLSFGLRDVIKNYVAGLLILFKSPFEIGDTVKIRSFTGKVEKIEFQSTTIRTFDRKEVTIHNSDVLTQPIVNFSKTQQARTGIEVLLGYGSDMNRAIQIFDAILGGNELILKSPKYSIVVKDFGKEGIKILIRFWVQKPCNVLRLKSHISLQIQSSFDEARIFAPYAREANLTVDYGMTEARKERLQLFYNQPILAAIAAQTAAQINGAAPAEEYADADEPE